MPVYPAYNFLKVEEQVMSKRHQEWLKVRRLIKKTNKSLFEDCFAGRFEVRLTGNKRDYQTANYFVYTPELFTADEASDPTWQYSYYEAEIRDNEEPERNFKIWFKYSDSFGLIDCWTDRWEMRSEYFDNSISSIWSVINNFIIKSDFWDKWNDIEYKKTHWYSGDNLKETIAILGEAYKDPVSAEEYRKRRELAFQCSSETPSCSNNETSKKASD